MRNRLIALSATIAFGIAGAAHAQDQHGFNCKGRSETDCAKLAVEAYGLLGTPPGGAKPSGYTRTSGPGFECPQGTARAGTQGVLVLRKKGSGTTADRYWCGAGEPPKE
jgi:hypothetical protein